MTGQRLPRFAGFAEASFVVAEFIVHRGEAVADLLFKVQLQRQRQSAANGAQQRVRRSGQRVRGETGREAEQRQHDAADGEEGEHSQDPLRQDQSGFQPFDLPRDADAALFEFHDPRVQMFDFRIVGADRRNGSRDGDRRVCAGSLLSCSPQCVFQTDAAQLLRRGLKFGRLLLAELRKPSQSLLPFVSLRGRSAELPGLFDQPIMSRDGGVQCFELGRRPTFAERRDRRVEFFFLLFDRRV